MRKSSIAWSSVQVQFDRRLGVMKKKTWLMKGGYLREKVRERWTA